MAITDQDVARLSGRALVYVTTDNEHIPCVRVPKQKLSLGSKFESCLTRFLQEWKLAPAPPRLSFCTEAKAICEQSGCSGEQWESSGEQWESSEQQWESSAEQWESGGEQWTLQHPLILCGYCKVHTDKGKGKGTRKRKPKGKHKGTDASSNHVVANDNDNEGTSGRCDHGDDALSADNADETNASD